MVRDRGPGPPSISSATGTGSRTCATASRRSMAIAAACRSPRARKGGLGSRCACRFSPRGAGTRQCSTGPSAHDRSPRPMKVRTVGVDDEKPARDRIKRFLAEHADFEVAGEAGDGESAVRVIEELRPDLVFLDVRMPEADGFEVLRRLTYVPRVVFATAYERYAVQAFEVHSIDYLLKPFDRKRFGATLARVRQEMRKRIPAEEKLGALLREIRQSALALRGAAEAVGEVVGEAASGAGASAGGIA